jgi:hypothetical protein
LKIQRLVSEFGIPHRYESDLRLLLSFSAIKRKYFLCRHTWKNKIMVDLFASGKSKAGLKASIPMGMKQVNAAFKNEPSKKVMNQAYEQGIKSLAHVIQKIEDSELSVPVVNSASQVSALPTQSGVLIENFLKPTLQSFRTDVPVQLRLRCVQQKEQQVTQNCDLEPSNKSSVPKLVESCLAQHEINLINWRRQENVKFKLSSICFLCLSVYILFVFCTRSLS